ncbi:hypothetical protein L345_15797, partial [Ophiophagus hannah]
MKEEREGEKETGKERRKKEREGGREEGREKRREGKKEGRKKGKNEERRGRKEGNKERKRKEGRYRLAEERKGREGGRKRKEGKKGGEEKGGRAWHRRPRLDSPPSSDKGGGLHLVHHASRHGLQVPPGLLLIAHPGEGRGGEGRGTTKGPGEGASFPGCPFPLLLLLPPPASHSLNDQVTRSSRPKLWSCNPVIEAESTTLEPGLKDAHATQL